MTLGPEDVRDILSLLDALPVDELDLRTERFRLTLRRSADGRWTQSGTNLDETGPQAVAPGQGGPEAASGAGVPVTGLADVRAPLPGTFYRAPKPGAPPFVQVGTRVEEDTVVGIVETMKMFNPIPAGLAGTVATIELADAEFAEQDAVLMRIAREGP